MPLVNLSLFNAPSSDSRLVLCTKGYAKGILHNTRYRPSNEPWWLTVPGISKEMVKKEYCNVLFQLYLQHQELQQKRNCSHYLRT